jgi:PAS domain S-box-containing protein
MWQMRDEEQAREAFGDALGRLCQTVNTLKSYVSSQQQTAEQLEVLISLSPDLLCIADETHLRWLNPAWEQALGWTTTELMDNPIDTFIHPEDLTANRAAIAQLAERPVGRQEVRWRHKDGSYRWLAWSGSQRVDGYTWVVARDIDEHKRADEAYWRSLHASEARFRGLLNSSSDLAAMVSKDMRVLAVNDALAEHIGYRPDQLLGRRLQDLCLESILTPFRLSHLEQVLQSGKPERFEDERNGRLFDTRLYPVFSIDGQVMAVACCSKDVTSAHEAQQALKRQTEWQAQLLESARHLTASLEIDQVLTRIATEARSVLRAYGCAVYLLEPDGQTLTPVVAVEPPYEDAILSTPLKVEGSFTGEAVKARRGLIFNDALNAEVGMQIPGTPLQHDERVIVVPFVVDEQVLGAMCLNRGGVPFTPDDLALGETFGAYAATALKNARVHRALQREVEERKRVEQALRESEERFRTIVETAPGVLHILDPQGRTVYASPNCVQITGFTPEELHNRLWWVHGNDMPKARALFEATLREKRGFRGFEYRAVRKDGELWHASSSGEPLLDQDGNVSSIIIQTADITERVRLEERLREAQKAEAVSRLAGGVAHEFNNLLTVIVGYGEFALNALEPKHPLREDMEAICRAGRRAAELTQQLLAFSRRQAFRAQVVHLNVLLQSMGGTLRHILGDQVKVVCRLCDGRGSVRADAAQIEQVITHLATNARDAMPDGGTFTLETRNVLVDTEQVDVSPGEYVLLIMSDTGCGMSPDVKQHLFEPFFTTKGVGQGTGLGLATIYGIITQLGGSVQVESEMGRGTIVRIYFPRVEVSAEDEPEL